jgi:hypothetical protein
MLEKTCTKNILQQPNSEFSGSHYKVTEAAIVDSPTRPGGQVKP